MTDALRYDNALNNRTDKRRSRQGKQNEKQKNVRTTASGCEFAGKHSLFRSVITTGLATIETTRIQRL